MDAEETFGREEEAGGEVLDLMEALRRSVERQRGDKSGGRTTTSSAKLKKTATKAAPTKTSTAKSGAAAKPARTTAKKSGRAKTA
jgi:DNA end-binding protein Ku